MSSWTANETESQVGHFSQKAVKCETQQTVKEIGMTLAF